MEFHFNFFNFTPIDIASINGHDSIVSLLIEAGANFNPKKRGADSPLIYAIQESQIQIVEILLYNQVNINHSNGKI